MTLLEHITQFSSYNYWANERLCGLTRKIDPAMLDLSFNSSFKTLRLTLYHIWDAETLWLKRLQGISLPIWPSKTHEDKELDFLDIWLGVSAGLVTMLEENGEEFLLREIKYTNTKGDAFSQPAREMFTQVFNHSTYHRGQVVSLLRQAGFTDRIPPLDIIAFFRGR